MSMSRVARVRCNCQVPDCVQADGNEMTGSTFACCLRSDCLTSDWVWGGSNSCLQGRLNFVQNSLACHSSENLGAGQATAAQQHWLIHAYNWVLVVGAGSWLASCLCLRVTGSWQLPCPQLVVGGGAAALRFPFVRVKGAKEQLIGLRLVLAARLGGGGQQQAVARAAAAQE